MHSFDPCVLAIQRILPTRVTQPLEQRLLPYLRAAVHPRQAPTSSTMSKFPFTSLPAELRNQIYKLALRGEDPVAIAKTPPDSKAVSVSIKELNEPVALTKAHRPIRQESTQLYYAINTFALQSRRCDAAKTLKSFLENIGTANAQSLRSIQLSFPHDPVEIAIAGEHFEELSRPLKELRQVAKQIPNCTVQALIEIRLPNDHPRGNRSFSLDLKDCEKAWRTVDDRLEDMVWTEPLSRNCCLLERFRKQLEGCRKELQCL